MLKTCIQTTYSIDIATIFTMGKKIFRFIFSIHFKSVNRIKIFLDIGSYDKKYFALNHDKTFANLLPLRKALGKKRLSKKESGSLV